MFSLTLQKTKLKSDVRNLARKTAPSKFSDLGGKTLIEKQIVRGYEQVEIDVNNLASGVYFCTLRTDKNSRTKKLIIE